MMKSTMPYAFDGYIEIKGSHYPIPAVLVKLFRDGYEDKSFANLVIETSPDCETST